MSERTLVALLVLRLREAVVRMLRSLGIPEAAVAAEENAMAQAAIGRTASRQVLGSISDFVRMLDSIRAFGAGA